MARVDQGATFIALSGLAVAAVLAGLTFTSAVQAQQPIRLLVGFPAGGPIDNAARLMAPPLGDLLGRQVIVDNRAGANGIVATEIAARATPDGRTLFFGTTGNLAVNPALYPKLPFDILRDLCCRDTGKTNRSGHGAGGQHAARLRYFSQYRNHQMGARGEKRQYPPGVITLVTLN